MIIINIDEIIITSKKPLLRMTGSENEDIIMRTMIAATPDGNAHPPLNAQPVKYYNGYRVVYIFFMSLLLILFYIFT